MSEGVLVDVTSFSATYVKGSNVLQLRGEFKALDPMKNVQFVNLGMGNGIGFEVRGFEGKGTRGSTKIADLDYRTSVIEKGVYKRELVFLTTKSKEMERYPIQFVDPTKDQPSSSATTGGSGSGTKGPPPPETLFLPWLEDATRAVKTKYTKPLLEYAEAKKTSAAGGGTLTNFARFRVQKTNSVTVTGDWPSVSSASELSSEVGTIADVSQLKYSPWDIVNSSGIPKIQDYATFSLGKYIDSQSSGGLPDQPYYEFYDSKKKLIALVGAGDGKKYVN